MVNRLINPLKSNSFFIFGARGVGKSTWINSHFFGKNVKKFDLLDDENFDLLHKDPKILKRIAETKQTEWIFIDEIQRNPSLLNQIHKLIEEHGQKFILTGSSSRKLKRGSANLLAGRAFVNQLFPLTSIEMGTDFSLDQALAWGTLPKLLSLISVEEKKAYLKSYCFTYIKEEIQMEQLVRKLEPFRDFLEVAAQMSGKIINASSIAKDVGVDTVTVQSYYKILEETYIGFYLPAFHRSVRKSQKESPKFFLFDNGVKRALERSLESIPVASTPMYGDLFEAFVIQEIFRLNIYFDKDYRLSYFATKNGSEIDLVLSRGRKIILIEIKSGIKKNQTEILKLKRAAEAFGDSVKIYYASNDKNNEVIEKVNCLHWTQLLVELKNDFN